jgi:hypothetical protein
MPNLGVGRTCAQFKGSTWAKKQMPGPAEEISAWSAKDVWTISYQVKGGQVLLHWNGHFAHGSHTRARPRPAYLHRVRRRSNRGRAQQRLAGPARPDRLPGRQDLVPDALEWQALAQSPLPLPNQLRLPDRTRRSRWHVAGLQRSGAQLSLVLRPCASVTQVDETARAGHDPDERSRSITIAWIPGTRSMWAIGSLSPLHLTSAVVGAIFKYCP